MATAPDSEGPPGDDPPTVHIHEVCSECLLAQCSHQRRARARQICACTLCTFAQPSTCRIACQCVIALQRCVSWLDQSWLIHFVCAENNAPASKRQKVGKGLHWSGVGKGERFELQVTDVPTGKANEKVTVTVQMQRNRQSGLSESVEPSWNFTAKGVCARIISTHHARVLTSALHVRQHLSLVASVAATSSTM